MKQLMIFLILGVLFFSSCTTTRMLTSNITPTEVNDLQKFETFSYISLIESGNRGKYNDTLSNQSKILLGEIFESFNKNIPITGQINVTDTIVKKRMEKEIELLCVMTDRKRSVSDLKLTPTLDSLLEKTGKRFGLISVTTGFTRKKGNYGGQVAKGAAMGILTLGMYYQVPIKAYSVVYVMIVDGQENNIAFFRKSFLKDKEPLDKVVVTRQIQKIFENYFFHRE